MGKKKGAVGARKEQSEAINAFANDLERKSLDSDGDDVVHAIEEAMSDDSNMFDRDQSTENGQSFLSEEEKIQVREELSKTEDEINTLRQVLNARQKHAAELKRKLGVNPWSEVTTDISEGLKHVRDSTAYQKTSEVVAHTTDTVKSKLNDMRNSSVFKSFESRLGSVYSNAKMAASTSIDHLAGHSRTDPPQAQGPATQPTTPSTEKSPLS
uniref:Tumor protein D52 n=1 Tax=Plectus sambesii TaxID=2011161 RepID=A0A914W7W8_9BILA